MAGYGLAMAWLWLGFGFAVAWLWLGYGLAMAWLAGYGWPCLGYGLLPPKEPVRRCALEKRVVVPIFDKNGVSTGHLG